MVVLAVLGSLAVPTLGWLGSAGQNVAATRLRTTLIFAQRWALGTGNSTWVTFDTSSDLVSVYVEDPANPGKANRVSMQDPLTRAPMTIPLGAQGVSIVSVDIGSTSEVQFDAEGSPLDAGGVALGSDGLVDLDGGGRIRITKSTGLITVD